MASIRKLSSGNYQVQIRVTGLPSVTRSFSKKKNATSFVRQVEGDSELLRKLGKAPAYIPTFKKLCDDYMKQYLGKDRTTVGRLNWWCEQFGETQVTKVDEFMVDEGLTKLQKKG